MLYLASSTFPAWELCEAHFVAKELGTARFDIEQPQLNLIDRRIEADVLPFCRRYGVATMTWAPLARGRLAGTYSRGGKRFPDGSWYAEQGKTDFPAAQWPVMRKVDELADGLGCTSSQLAIAWVCQVSGVTSAILGPRTVEQLTDNLGAARVELRGDDLAALDAINPAGELARDPSAGPVPR